jgi:hypothetical protein
LQLLRATGSAVRPDHRRCRRVLEDTQEREEIIQRIAALDIG